MAFRPEIRWIIRTGIAVLSLLGLLGMAAGSGQADEPAKQQTPEEQEKLKKEFLRFSDEALRQGQEGREDEAIRLQVQAIALAEKLYPKNLFPDGHSELAQSLRNLGFLLHQFRKFSKPAQEYYGRALAMRQKLYPRDKYPNGHPQLASSLNDLGGLMGDWGRFPQAQSNYKRSLAIAGSCSPGANSRTVTAISPKASPTWASCYMALGRLEQAQSHLEEALAMNARLYPREKYPEGHSELANSLNNMGFLLQARRLYPQAQGYLERALAMKERLYGPDKYPKGHLQLAVSLNNLGALLWAQGSFPQALGYYKRALAMLENLYPDGHPDLATSLNNLSNLLVARGSYTEAQDYLEHAWPCARNCIPGRSSPRDTPTWPPALIAWAPCCRIVVCTDRRKNSISALAMRETLYPKDKFPDGHPHLAGSLNNLGFLFHARGMYRQAQDYYERALAMNEKLYPNGHHYLAISLNNLAGLLGNRGALDQAQGYDERALAMYEKLYPQDRYPKGHPNLATCLNNLGSLLWDRGAVDLAQGYLERALAMREKLYSKDDYPDGHPELASSLNNLGALLSDRGSYVLAQSYYERALAMRERLYPKDKYPDGHLDLANSLHNLGSVLVERGRHGEAQDRYERALAMLEKLYPKDKYPYGHFHQAQSLNNLGGLMETQGSYTQAQALYERALTMQCQQIRDVASWASEAEALDLAQHFPLTRDSLFSVTGHIPASDAAAYAGAWGSRALVTRVLQQRHLAARAAQDARTKAAWQELRDTRRHLARLLVQPARDPAERDRDLARLNNRKQTLERQLADLLPQLKRPQEMDRLGSQDLVSHLPDGCVFLDFVRYNRFSYDPKKPGKDGETRTPSYTVFILSKGQPVRRVELGPAEPIDEAVNRWRGALTGPPPPTSPAHFESRKPARRATPPRFAAWPGRRWRNISRRGRTPCTCPWTATWLGFPGPPCPDARRVLFCWKSTGWRLSCTALSCWSVCWRRGNPASRASPAGSWLSVGWLSTRPRLRAKAVVIQPLRGPPRKLIKCWPWPGNGPRVFWKTGRRLPSD